MSLAEPTNLSESASNRIKNSKLYILEEWAKRTQNAVPAALKLSNSEFYNNIPDFIDALSEIISTTSTSINGDRSALETLEICKKHGATRAAIPNYTLDLVILEYQFLRQVIFEVIEANSSISTRERLKLMESIDYGLLEAAAEFSNQLGFRRSRYTGESQEQTRELRLKLVQSEQQLLTKLQAQKSQLNRETKELKESELQTRELLDGLPQPIWILYPDGFLEYYNKRWQEYTGFTLEESRIRGWDQIVHSMDLPLVIKEWSKCIKLKTPMNIEFRLKGKDGVFRWFLGQTRAIQDSNMNIIKWVGSATNIDQQKKVLEDLEIQRKLRESFVTTLTHDLRTPLTAARMSLELLMSRTFELEVGQALLKRIDRDLVRIDQMIQDLLDANQIRAGEKLPIRRKLCDVHAVVLQTIEVLKSIYGDRFILRDGHSILSFVDCRGIQRIIENLCSNAIKYGVSYCPIIITLTHNDKVIKIEVLNRGPVLTPAEQESIFLPFQRGNSAKTSGKKGWGLGLTLVKAITESHGGNILLRSNELEGTIFTVTIPKASECL